jgi:hypothetical protein
MYQPSHHNRVIIKVFLRYTEGAGWGVCIEIGICSSAWRKDTLGPLGRITSMKLCSIWLGHEDEISQKRVEYPCQQRDWTKYDDADDQIWDKCQYQSNKGNRWSDKCWYQVTKGIWLSVYVQRDMCIRGIHMGHYGHPGPTDDHWSNMHVDHVYSVPEP